MAILIVGKKDEKNSILCEVLNESGYECTIITTIEKVEEILNAQNINLIFLEWGKNIKNLSDFIYNIKTNFKKKSIVVIEEVYNKDNEVSTLNCGADDYVLYPFLDNYKINTKAFRALKARIEARLRFGGTNVIDLDDLVIDPDEEKIFYKEKEMELKGKPFEVLTHLARRRGQIVSKEQLLDAIWEEPELVTPNVIEVAINQIRQRMDKPLGIGTIETIRRRGYRFCYPNCQEIGVIKSE